MNRIQTEEETKRKLGLGQSELAAAFPEFYHVKDRLIYGELWQQGALSDELRALITVAALTTVEGEDLKEQVKAALHLGVAPAALREVFHQAAPYIGFAKAEKGLKAFAQVCREEGIALPLEACGTVTEEDRLEKGIAAQSSIFGGGITAMRANAPADQKGLQDYLSAYCFGDTYTRTGLDVKTRELLTFVCILCLGGCDPQARAHVGGNLAVGNDRGTLVAAVCQCLPYIGFPRTLNAISAINEVAK